MERLPYGTFKTLTPEEQKAHMKELRKRDREKNREKRNAYNKTFFDRWKIEKPFICTCKYCGSQFNAPRNNRYVCPECHAKRHNAAEFKRFVLETERNAKKNRNLIILQLAEKGLTHKEIAKTVQVAPRVVSAVCVKKGLRRKEYVSRIK